ncbi:MAG: extracellular solute-binding protein [Propionicimonas sp.]
MTRLKVWLKAGHTVAIIDQLRAGFEEATGIGLDVRVVPESTAHDLLVAGSERPDVVTVPFWYLDELLERDVLREAGDVDGLAFPRVPLDALSRGGVLYAVPHTFTGGMLTYRKDILDGAGIDPPATPGEVLAAARVLGEKGWSLAARANQQFSSLETYAGWAHAAGVRLLHDSGPANVHELQRGIGELVAVLRRQGGSLAELDYEGVGGLVTQGRAALMFDTSAWAFSFEAPGSPVRGLLGYRTIVDAQPAQFLYAEGLGITSWCADPEAAAAFVNWRHSEAVLRREVEEVRRIDIPRLDLRELDWFGHFVERERLGPCLAAVDLSWQQAELSHVARRPDYVDASRALMRVISGTVSGEFSSIEQGYEDAYAQLPRQ